MSPDVFCLMRRLEYLFHDIFGQGHVTDPDALENQEQDLL